ncbi:hypothetical protein [Nocardia sp. NPDC059239]|uniref:hypothetical protein n=1 Tax=unclassified Nocardia TaxID=2637762 RepID=UPI00367A696A
MTTEGASEFPPLDGAADLSRATQLQQGEVLADSRNWAGFALMFFGVLATAVAFLALWLHRPTLGLVGTTLAVVGLVSGAALIVLERRRRTTVTTDIDEPIVWRPAGPPRY